MPACTQNVMLYISHIRQYASAYVQQWTTYVQYVCVITDSLDHISTVILNGPIQGVVHNELAYSINVTLMFGTNYTGPVTYVWNFGDGTTSTGATVSHTYHQANEYVISYTASNPVGSQTNTTTILIEEGMNFNIVKHSYLLNI